MDFSENDDMDELNEETFGDDDYGDWEADHEQYLKKSGFNDSNVICKSQDDCDLDKSFSLPYDIEESIDRLVTDEVEYVDPAVLDVSKKKQIPKANFTNNLQFPDLGLFHVSESKIGKIWNTSHNKLDEENSAAFSHDVKNGSYPHQNSPEKLHKLSQMAFSTNRLSSPSSYVSNPYQNGNQVPPRNNLEPGAMELVQLLDKLKLEVLKGNQDPNSIDSELLSKLVQYYSVHDKSRVAAPLINNFVPRPQSSFTNSQASPGPLVTASQIPFQRPPIDMKHMMMLFQSIPPVQQHSSHPAQQLPTQIPFYGQTHSPRFLMRPISPPAPQSSCSSQNNLDTFFDQDTSHTRQNYSQISDPAIISSQDNSLMEEIEFDPKTDDWMSEYQIEGIRRFHHRNLYISNPYILDYYFTIMWLREKNVEHNLMIARFGTSVTRHIKAPIYKIPSPIDAYELFSLADNHPHLANLRHRLVLTASDAPAVAAANATLEEVKMSLMQFQQSSGNLGRATRSNYQTQRVIAELSVASAIASPTKPTKNDQEIQDNGWDDSDNCSNATIRSTGTNTVFFPGKSVYTATSVGYAPDMLDMISARKRRLILARIERMYSLILNLDETQFSMAYIVVKNENWLRLFKHFELLKNQLKREFYHRKAAPSELIWVQKLINQTSDSRNLSVEVPHLDILTIRKGIWIFGKILVNIDDIHLQLAMSYLVNSFQLIEKNLPISIEEFSEILFVNLKRVAFRIVDITRLLTICIPPELFEVAQKWMEVNSEKTQLEEFSPFDKSKQLNCDAARNSYQFLITPIGLTFILFMLDSLACKSDRNDPREFTYWSKRLAICVCTIPLDHKYYSLEKQHQLAGILRVFVEPLTANDIASENKLSRLAYDRLINLAVSFTPSKEDENRKTPQPTNGDSSIKE